MTDGILKPVNTIATGEWQLMRMESRQCYILVHPNGRQAWFHDDQINKVKNSIPHFRFTANPMKDLERLAKNGLVPFHVDPDFNVADFTVN